MNSDQPVMPSSVETLTKELTRQPASQCRVSSLVIFMATSIGQVEYHAPPNRGRQLSMTRTQTRVLVDIVQGRAYFRPAAECPGGGIGRRAGFRYLWQQCRGSSSLLLGTTAPRPMTHHLHRGDLPERVAFGA